MRAAAGARLRFAGVCAGIVAAVLLAYALLWGSVQGFVEAMDHCGILFCDFDRHYHAMGRRIFAERAPVWRFLYTPGFAILLSPFGALDKDTALPLWGAFQLASLAVLAAFCVGVARRRSEGAGYLALGLTLTSQPVLHNFKWGQMSVPLVAAVLLAAALARRGRGIAGGALLAIATGVKYYAALFALPFLLRRDARALAGFAAGLIFFLVLLPGALLGLEETRSFYAAVHARLAEVDAVALRDPNSQSLAAVADRLWGGAFLRLTGRAHAWPGYALAAANLAGLAWARRRLRSQQDEWTLTLLFASLPFLLPTSWPHYFAYLPFGQAFVLCALAPRGEPLGARAAALALLWLPSVLLSNVVVFVAFGPWQRYSASGCLFFSNLLLLAAAYAGLALGPARRPSRSSAP